MADTLKIDILIAEIESGWSKFLRLVQTFPQDENEAKLAGKSTFKDVLAHIHEWEKFLLDNLPQVEAKTVLSHKLNIKKMNFEFYQRNNSRSMEEIMADLMATHEKLVEMVRELDENLLSEPDPFYPKKYNVYNLIQHGTSLHYPWANKYLRLHPRK